MSVAKHLGEFGRIEESLGESEDCFERVWSALKSIKDCRRLWEYFKEFLNVSDYESKVYFIGFEYSRSQIS